MKACCGPFPCWLNRLLLRQYAACESHDSAYGFLIRQRGDLPEYRGQADNQLLTDLLREGCPGWRAVAYWAAARMLGGVMIKLKRRMGR